MPEYKAELQMTSGKALEYKKKRVEKDKYPADFVAMVLQSLSLGEDFSANQVSNAFYTLKTKGLKVIKEKPFRWPLNFVGRDGLLRVVNYYYDMGKIKEYKGVIDNIISEKKKLYLSKQIS